MPCDGQNFLISQQQQHCYLGLKAQFLRKYFVEFYSSLGISNCIVPNSRFEKHKNKKNINIEIECTKELENQKNETKGSKLKKLLDLLQNSDCSLKEISTNLVFSDGNENSSIMIIGGNGGEEEELENLCWSRED